jgi:hypothetical protein
MSISSRFFAELDLLTPACNRLSKEVHDRDALAPNRKQFL